MRSSSSPQSLRRNGDTTTVATPSASPQTRIPYHPATASPSPLHHHHHHHFHSTVAVQKLRRFNSLILVFRVVTFIFSLSSAIFMATNYRGSDSVHWYDFDAFRFVLAAGGIVALYSLFEMVASVWEITRGITLFPEVIQVWFDFSHDQVFAYMLISAESAGTALAKTLKKTDTCSGASAFCLQSDISLGLGFIGFLFLGFSSLLSGFRLGSFIINGSRFHL